MFYLGDHVFHLDRALIQTLMYLKLSWRDISKFSSRGPPGPFWSIRPARILLVAVFRHANRGDAGRGLWIVHAAHRLGWALMVWGYSLHGFLVNDRVKLLAYRIF